MAKQIAVIRMATAMVARKNCNRRSRALKPNRKPSMGPPSFYKELARDCFPGGEPAGAMANAGLRALGGIPKIGWKTGRQVCPDFAARVAEAAHCDNRGPPT